MTKPLTAKQKKAIQVTMLQMVDLTPKMVVEPIHLDAKKLTGYPNWNREHENGMGGEKDALYNHELHFINSFDR